MEDFVRVLLYPFIGWAYLWMRYRNKEEVQNILKNEFDGSYKNAGSIIILHFIGIIMIVLLISFLLIVIYRTLFPLKT